MSDIRLIAGPKVYLLARPAIDHRELTRFLRDTGFPDWTTAAPSDAQALVEIGARTCYRSFRSGEGRSHDDHVANLLEKQHYSTFEHAVWTLLVTGVSRSLSHELVRHRHLSPSQESQRYVDASDVAFVVPPELLADHAKWAAEMRAGAGHWSDPAAREFALWLEGNERDVRDYRAWVARLEARGLGRKKARQAARSRLPGCCETRLQLTGNARCWRELLVKRLSPAADEEFIRLSRVILGVLAREAPGLFAGLGGEGRDR